MLENGAHEHGDCGTVVDRLVGAGVCAVIAGGMGGGPRTGFAAAGVPIFFDSTSPTPAVAVAVYLAGSAESFDDEHQCQGH